MRISLTVLGWELLALELGPAAVACEDDPGDCTSYPIGFAGTHGVPDMHGPYREGWE